MAEAQRQTTEETKHIEPITEETKFRVNLMKFIFNVCARGYPIGFKEDLKNIPREPSIYYSENIAKAAIIFVSKAAHRKVPVYDIATSAYQEELNKVLFGYNPYAFIRFFSLYGEKASEEGKYLGSYTKFRNDIQHVIDTHLVEAASWEKLDQIACQIVRNDDCESERKSALSPDGKVDIDVEDKFVLNVMRHIFSLHFVKLPDCLARKLYALNENISAENIFSENVGEALTILLINQYQLKHHIGWEIIERYYYESLKEMFKVREFLEFCVCLSQKAAKNFIQLTNTGADNKTTLTVKIYDIFYRMLRGLKLKGALKKFNLIEEVAVSILEDEEEKIDHLTDTKLNPESEKMKLIRALEDSLEEANRRRIRAQDETRNKREKEQRDAEIMKEIETEIDEHRIAIEKFATRKKYDKLLTLMKSLKQDGKTVLEEEENSVSHQDTVQKSFKTNQEFEREGSKKSTGFGGESSKGHRYFTDDKSENQLNPDEELNPTSIKSHETTVRHRRSGLIAIDEPAIKRETMYENFSRQHYLNESFEKPDNQEYTSSNKGQYKSSSSAHSELDDSVELEENSYDLRDTELAKSLETQDVDETKASTACPKQKSKCLIVKDCKCCNCF